MSLEIKEIAALATCFTAIIGLCALVWRYLLSPFARLIARLLISWRETSATLPVLHELLQHWPEPSGPGSFIADVEALDRLSQHTHTRVVAVLDLLHTPIYECTPAGECIHANRALCDLFELSLEGMMGNRWLQGIHPDDRIPTWEQWHQAVASRVPYESTYRVRGVETRTIKQCVSVAYPMMNHHGELIAYFGKVEVIDHIGPADSTGPIRPSSTH